MRGREGGDWNDGEFRGGGKGRWERSESASMTFGRKKRNGVLYANAESAGIVFRDLCFGNLFPFVHAHWIYLSRTHAADAHKHFICLYGAVRWRVQRAGVKLRV